MWSKVVPEIHEMIVQYLHTPKDVLSCCLVNRSWYQNTSRYLFRYVHLSSKSLEMFMNRFCKSCENLKSKRARIDTLKIDDYQCDDVVDTNQDLVKLAFFKSVFKTIGPNKLHLANCASITDATLSTLLVYIPYLEELILDSLDSISCASLSECNNLPLLKKLKLLRWKGSLYLDLFCPSLIDLEISRNATLENDIIFLNCPLVHLKLTSVAITDKCLKDILVPSLKHLEISCRAPRFRFKGPGLLKIGELYQLKSLKLAFLDVNTSILEQIGKLTLEELYFEHVDGLMDFGLEYLRNPLNTFRLRGNSLVTTSALVSFLERTGIKRLEIQSSPFLDEELLDSLVLVQFQSLRLEYFGNTSKLWNFMNNSHSNRLQVLL